MAAPARRQLKTIQQPDGSTITIQLQGDEWHHWTTDDQGHLLSLDNQGIYRLATEAEHRQWQATHAEAQARRTAYTAKHRRSATRGVGEINDDNNPSDSPVSHFTFPTQGVVRGLVVLVEYTDIQFSIIDDPHQEYTDMLNKKGYNRATINSQGKPSTKFYHRGSARDYYILNSDSIFTPEFDVFGPIPLEHERAYYGKNSNNFDARPGEMITEACHYLDSIGIDLSRYDANNDGVIDFVFAIYAGEGENAVDAPSEAVWPHSWDVPSATGSRYFYQDYEVRDYACTCEIYGGQLDGVGTFCHEFTHVLGLPDVYNTDNNKTILTAGDFDVLDTGCYNLNGYCPCNLSAYERYELGWLKPEVLNDPAQYFLPAVEHGPAYIIPITEGLKDPREGEYYLLENRQQVGSDEPLPGHGMLLWHIDFSASAWSNNVVNNSTDHLCIDLIEANNANNHNNDAGIPFPGAEGISQLSDDTTPALSGWSEPGNRKSSELGNRLEKDINGITESADGEISFWYLMQPISLPSLPAETRNDAHRIIIDHQGRTLIQTPHGLYNPMGLQIKE